MIDYAMADDFPTVNTDFFCQIGDDEFTPYLLDISFNLPIEAEPVLLLYKPIQGTPFTIPYTAPLCLQVSWKLHQTLVRPRFKDIFDLIYLLQNPSFSNITLQQTLQALANECSADSVDIQKLKFLISGELEKLFLNGLAKAEWFSWRHNKRTVDLVYGELAEYMTNPSNLPNDMSAFSSLFSDVLNKAGFTLAILDSLPAATWEKSIYNHPDQSQQETVIQEPKTASRPKGVFSFFSKLFR